MKHSLKVGFRFGLASGVITTLGLMVGLNAGTHSRTAVLGGILTIAIADSFADALGIHISEESENKHTSKEIWISTIAAIVSKFIFALTFSVPVLLLELSTAIVVSIAWGLLVITAISYIMAKEQRKKPYRMIVEHVLIAILVVVATNFAGVWIGGVFG